MVITHVFLFEYTEFSEIMLGLKIQRVSSHKGAFITNQYCSNNLEGLLLVYLKLNTYLEEEF